LFLFENLEEIPNEGIPETISSEEKSEASEGSGIYHYQIYVSNKP